MAIYSFKPHPFVRGGNLQTILAHFTGTPNTLKGDEVLTVDLADNDQIAIDLNFPETIYPDSAVVVLCHGLGGSANSHYMIRIAEKLTKAGLIAARLNHRGCDNYGIPAKEIYHSGSSDDIRAGLEAVHRRWPLAPLIVVGFSISGSILLNLLGRNPDIGLSLCNFRKAIAICPPIDLEQSSLAVSSLKNKHYDIHYTKGLVKSAQKRRERFPSGYHPDLPKRINLRIFDEIFTAKLGGFKNRADYYESCSPLNVASKIAIATTVIVAADDPIIPIESVTKANFSKYVDLRVEKSGGHMGFIAAQPLRYGDYRWMDAAVINLVEQSLDRFP